MIFFKEFKLFEADEKTEPKDPATDQKNQQGQEKVEGPVYREKFTFKNSFNYNKIAVNDSFEKTMKEAIDKLDQFMNNENKEKIVNVVQINASGFASWVPTQYKNKVYALNNNKTLANDRAASIAEEVKQRIIKYFNDKGIKKINFEKSEIKGSIDYKNSKQVFSDYIKNNYNAKSLVEEINNIKPQGPKDLKFVKDVSKITDPEKYLNVNDYATKHADNILTIKSDLANADQIYENMQKTPLYVLYTSHLKSGGGVETAYRNSTQYAVVEIAINDKSETTTPPPPQQEKANLKSISFQDDVDTPDADGTAAIKMLVEYLNKTKADQIENLILLGHAEGDDELNPPKIKFDPNNQQKLKDKDGKETIMTEAQLCDLRFVLSIARCKAVYRSVENLETIKELVKRKALWLLPCGTLFGDELSKSANHNQKIVQIVVQTKNGTTNTEPTVDYGDQLKTPTLTKINAFVNELNYNFSKFIPKVFNSNDFGSPVPNHLELAKDPNALATWHKQFVA